MKQITLIFTVLFMISSCQIEPCVNKSYFLSTYKNFIKAVEKNKKEFTESDWVSKDEKMKGFVDDCYPAYVDEMSVEDKSNFWSSYLTFMVARHKGKILKAIQKEDSESVVEIYQELTESVSDIDLKQLLKENYGDDLEGAIDDALERLEGLGDKLKDWLNASDQ